MVGREEYSSLFAELLTFPLGPPQSVHIDAYSAMSGSTLFTHTHLQHINYNRNESISSPHDFLPFDYLITHDPLLHNIDFETVATTRGFVGMGSVNVLGKLQLPLAPRFENLIWIMKKREVIDAA